MERGIKFCNYLGIANESMVRIVGEAAEGWYTISFAPSPLDTQLPGMEEILTATKKYRGWGPERATLLNIIAWIEARVGVEGIKLAVQQVGIENLSGRAVRDALASMKNVDIGLISPITTSEDAPYFTRFFRMYQVQRGRTVPVSDWIEGTWLPEFE
jgi:hypothetical protein